MSVIPLKYPHVMRSEENFIRTYTGRKFWPLDPKPEEVHIEDIAHALSLTCRFTGHCKTHYSVADHSLRVSKLAAEIVMGGGVGNETIIAGRAERVRLAREIALWGLLHDASEAYLCDLPSPIKRAPGMGQVYKLYESRLMDVIAQRFNLIPHEPVIVKNADRMLLNTEMRDLMCGANYSPEVLSDKIYAMRRYEAEEGFLRRFHLLIMARETDADLWRTDT
ncbi:MAG TPA: YfbR-like 5'-deoxynucleotidase [Terracidiphilus sp.]|nr:YfbR-like 5'-deoxynucleotidase [Terracidiphilus sp.]